MENPTKKQLLHKEKQKSSLNRKKQSIIIEKSIITQEKTYIFPSSLLWIPQLKHTTVNEFLPNLFSGLLIGILILPQGIGYASLIPLPMLPAITSAVICPFISAFLTQSLIISIGPSASLYLLLSQIDHKNHYSAEYYILMAFFIGIYCIVLSVMKLGFLEHVFSVPLFKGYIIVASFQIALE